MLEALRPLARYYPAWGPTATGQATRPGPGAGPRDRWPPPVKATPNRPQTPPG